MIAWTTISWTIKFGRVFYAVMDAVDKESFDFAISQITNGFVFESFAQDFLSSALGYEFIPVGGIHDRAIDGLEHSCTRRGAERYIYQMSIEGDPESKIKKTLTALTANKVEFEAFYYVTNQPVEKVDVLKDSLFEKYKKPVNIYDLNWLSHRVNSDPGCIRAFNTFVTKNVHQFNTPGKHYVVADLVKDPRVFVYLRHQWDDSATTVNLQDRLADALILYALEGTDPDKNLLKTADEVKASIAASIKFTPKLLDSAINRRLKALSTIPKKINHHTKTDSYCLPYETRLEINRRNLKDQALHHNFIAALETDLRKYLQEADTRVRDCIELIEDVVHALFYQQGLEFSQFILQGGNNDVLQKNLPDLVSRVVDSSPVVQKNREAVKTALVIAIRNLVYNGTTEEKLYLNKLSHTYLMLFLLQCDPKLSIFFTTLASKLEVYVCTSIIIPALSEYFLEPRNRRYWNLLKGASLSGVQLIINETIVSELVSHFKMIKRRYEEMFKDAEDCYLKDEINSLYIDEILIRAYFYAKLRGRVDNFRSFLDTFVNPDLKNAEEDFIEWLKHEFGMIYRPSKSLGISIDPKESELIVSSLKHQKHNEIKAKSDTETILTIYALREKHNETDKSGIFGYSTWWLSTDTTTQRALNDALKNKHQVTCYIRPDFLYNYISLAPKKPEMDALYQELFPSMLGVNLSFHLPPEVIQGVQNHIKEHKNKNPARLRAVLREFSEKIKSDQTLRNKNTLKHFFEEKLKETEQYRA